MKKIVSLMSILILSVLLASCDEVVIDEDTFDESLLPDMIETLSLRNTDNRMSMDELSTMIQSGEYLESDRDFYLYCDVLRNTVQNDDGSYTETYTFYDYDYDIYEEAYESLYNGIDDDDDGLIDEDDEITVFMTDEMNDGIDNNHNGVIDEYFEMTPSFVVTYTITYNEGNSETVASEDGTVTTTYSYFYSYTEVRTPYTGQIIAYGPCYSYDEESGEYTDDETTNSEDSFNDDLLNAYIELLNNVQEALSEISLLDQRALGIVYAELSLGRALTEEEKVAINLVWDLYESLDVNTNTFEVFDTEIEYLEFYLGRALTDEEKAAIEMVETISNTQTESISLEQIIEFYESILNRTLTDLEKDALALYEYYGD